MTHSRRQMGGALLVAAMAVGTLAVAGNPAMGAGAAPAAAATGLPLPSLPPLPPVPLPTLPALPPPVVKPPVTPPAPVAPPPAQPGGGAAPPPAAAPPAAAPPAAAPPAAAPPPGGAAPALAGSAATPVPGSGTASTAGDPGADLFPQPPVDPATTPQARLVARLGEAQERVRYLQAVLTRTRADLAVAQRQLGPADPMRALLTGATGPAPGGSVDTPDGRVLALSSATTSSEAELARRQAEALLLQRQVNDSVEQAMAVAKAAPVPPNATTYTGGRLRRPLAGPITSLFGNRQDPYYHVWQLHAGVDLGAPAGTAIHAAAPGRVTQAGWSGGYGNYTCIDHGQVDGQRLSTCYAHQQRILVTPGQQVGAGDVIGQVGSTGASTGPHLHFEVRLGGRPVDPMPWI